MSVDFFHRIAYRLTRSTVVIAFILGILISIVQVIVDFKKQQSSIDDMASEIYMVSKDSATRIAYQLDESYARELIDGLNKYQVLFAAALTDDRENTLAGFKQELEFNSLTPLTEALIGRTTDYTFPLNNSNQELAGYLLLTIDNHQALMPFYNRAFYVFWAGLVRNMLLAGILLVVFYLVVTKPLIQLAQNVSKITPANSKGQKVKMISDHKDSEIGYIINAINSLVNSSNEYQQELSQVEQQLRLTMDTVPLMILVVNEHHQITFANTKTENFFDQTQALLVGKTVEQIQRSKNSFQSKAIHRVIEKVFKEKDKVTLDEITLQDIDNKQHVFEANFLPLQQSNQASVLVVLNDVTEKAESQKVIRHLAFHDSLTGLANRTLFQQKLESDIKAAKYNNQIGAVMFIDLDKFKLVNDTLGHAVGDKVLIDVARELSSILKGKATLSRIGGDEFAVTYPNLGSDLDKAQLNAVLIAESINKALNTEINLAGQGYQVGASIGVVCYPNTADNETSLLQYADAALYQAKNEGRNRVNLFKPEIISQLTTQVKTEHEVRRGIKNNEFTIAIQPIFEAQTLMPVAAEALIRWQHPEKGLLGPHHFLDCFESLNLSHNLSNCVIAECGKVAHQIGIQSLLQSEFRFSVNISTLEFYEPDFSLRIEQQILKANLPFELFELEITETIAFHDLTLANEKLAQLTKRGIRISLDDFGTGYSSLSYLKRLDVNKVKIDKTFIESIANEQQDQRLVDSIIRIANNFDLNVVIEGLETSEQLRWLEQYKHVWYQGYYFSRPLEQSKFIELMKQQVLKPEETTTI